MDLLVVIEHGGLEKAPGEVPDAPTFQGRRVDNVLSTPGYAGRWADACQDLRARTLDCPMGSLEKLFQGTEKLLD